MFKLKHVKPKEATGEIRKAYDLFPPQAPVPTQARLFSASPFLLKLQAQAMRHVMGNERVEYPMLTAIRFMAAAAFGHDPDLSPDPETLRQAGLDGVDMDSLDEDMSGLPVDNYEIVLLKLMRKVLWDPASVTMEDVQACRDAGWLDSDILELSALGASLQAYQRLLTAFRK